MSEKKGICGLHYISVGQCLLIRNHLWWVGIITVSQMRKPRLGEVKPLWSQNRKGDSWLHSLCNSFWLFYWIEEMNELILCCMYPVCQLILALVASGFSLQGRFGGRRAFFFRRPKTLLLVYVKTTCQGDRSIAGRVQSRNSGAASSRPGFSM